ncbi:MAG: mannose-1-phosphate guanylyltransferase [Fimbriimonadaceae bacterium]
MSKLRQFIVMAGGSGERFWPLSRQTRPKQLLPLGESDRSLLQEAVDRLLAISGADQVYVATSRPLRPSILAAGLPLPDRNVIAEPAKRNTAGCVSYAIAELIARNPGVEPSDISLGFVTADHHIPQSDLFLQVVQRAMDAVEAIPAIGIVGISPSRVETGYGYVRYFKDPVKELKESNDLPVYPVQAFLEKPSRELAEQFIEQGNCLWNSGMFFGTVETFLNELSKTSPPHFDAIGKMVEAIRDSDEAQLAAVFDSLPDISIDYALAEKASRVVVVRTDLVWDDIGAWDAVSRTKPRDNSGNVVVGEAELIDCNECVVYNDFSDAGRAVAVIGVEDLVVVATDGGVLVMPKSRSQDVKLAVQKLKEKNSRQL